MKKLFAIMTILALFAAPALAERSMAGSYVELLAPSSGCPGGVYTFEFYVWNGSVDTEWVSNIILTFPDCFTVQGGSWIPDPGASGGFDFILNGIGTNVAAFDDANGGWGEIYGTEGGTFYVEVLIGDDCPVGPTMIHWFIQGDIYGGEPHFAEGDLDFTIGGTPVEPTSFSNVKALF